jgi:outer membrane protein OmpA-like peptidoglycan-associated protein
MHLPMTVYQFTGGDPASNGVGSGGLTGYHGALGDLRIDARGRLWSPESGKMSLGVEGFFTMSTGADVGFGGDRSGTAELLATYEQHFRKFFIAANLGPHFRPNNGVYGTNGDLRVGNELRFSVGGYMPLRDTLRVGVELWGGTGIEEIDGQSTFFSQRNTFIEWLAQARMTLDPNKQIFANFGLGTRLAAGYGTADFRLMAGIGYAFRLKDKEPPSPPPRVTIVSRPEHYETDTDGDGYPDGIDNCPNDKEDGKPPKKTDGCPAEADRDNDGIPDRLDRCPDKPEDLDKIDDKDGCPEEDADRDAVLDVVDECPLEPGPPNADRSKNGCPTLTKVSGDGSIALLKNIEFDLGRATIKPVSYPILNEVVTLMKARSTMRLAVHGHTDSQGDHDQNMKLSKDRAASVRRYLIGQGIKADRIESEGFGPDKPLASNDTAEGRAKNRRVEFIVLGEDEGDTDW